MLCASALWAVPCSLGLSQDDGPLRTVPALSVLGHRHSQYLDDVIFADPTALSAVQTLLHELCRFGWLVHPTKCCGVSQAAQAFQAHGTWVDLASQTFSVPPATVRASWRRQAPSLLGQSRPQCGWCPAFADWFPPIGSRRDSPPASAPGPWRP